jgi:hypothetical protein
LRGTDYNEEEAAFQFPDYHDASLELDCYAADVWIGDSVRERRSFVFVFFVIGAGLARERRGDGAGCDDGLVERPDGAGVCGLCAQDGSRDGRGAGEELAGGSDEEESVDVRRVVGIEEGLKGFG